MNPYDADTHPGPYLVVEVLGVGDVSVHALAHGPEEPLHQAATRVIEAAAALDERHESVRDAVQRAQRLLEGIGRGEAGHAQVSYALLTALPFRKVAGGRVPRPAASRLTRSSKGEVWSSLASAKVADANNGKRHEKYYDNSACRCGSRRNDQASLGPHLLLAPTGLAAVFSKNPSGGSEECEAEEHGDHACCNFSAQYGSEAEYEKRRCRHDCNSE
ncbi:hypothetical protein AB0C59_20445 [Streptomyces sp. NPDC048664]|uniref:hypothetical protein n=1 Tax=Streptomyces sp. NPDC048664 TaxID=3154505 RepID=UPI00341B6958